MKIENQYIIHFKGLKEGIHVFSFSIDRAFFELFEHLDIPDGQLTVTVHMHKKNSFMELGIALSGKVQVQCDRCLEYFELPVEFEGQLIIRFSETEKEPLEDIVFLHPEEDRIDLKHYLYESISLSLPIRKVHPDLADGREGCNREMLEKLKEHLIRD